MTAPGAPAAWRPRWSRHLGRVLAHGVWATDVVDAHHVPTDGPVIIAANHIGVADGPVLHGAVPRPTHILVKHEVFRGPMGVVLRGAGQIPVDRRNGRPALTAALAVLRRGGAVGIFPEGVRGQGDASGSRAGAAWLAVQSGAPVVPTAILGTRRTGEAIGRPPGPRRRLVVAFGEPVTLDLTGMSRREAVTLAGQNLRDALGAHVAATIARTGVTLPVDTLPADVVARREGSD